MRKSKLSSKTLAGARFSNLAPLEENRHGRRTSKTSFQVKSRPAAGAFGFKANADFCLRKLQGTGSAA